MLATVPSRRCSFFEDDRLAAAEQLELAESLSAPVVWIQVLNPSDKRSARAVRHKELTVTRWPCICLFRARVRIIVVFGD